MFEKKNKKKSFNIQFQLILKFFSFFNQNQTGFVHFMNETKKKKKDQQRHPI